MDGNRGVSLVCIAVLHRALELALGDSTGAAIVHNLCDGGQARGLDSGADKIRVKVGDNLVLPSDVDVVRLQHHGFFLQAL
ncbi:MAG: hypothetical protein MJZ05_10380 [Fibrobacter sp.]|nr:hypothetical protein [Fibrobacter sp.]